ncbi:olfactory receptor 11L1-like [Bombina bombina]|uniref:olfactory receptor 11L1-like n=1 Tax=Bombina bombina TaxID=8345 RepID=UPI00235AB086|nr:olfactory receptor 11L1-like [Bombina bombina]
MHKKNQTSVTTFLLLGFQNHHSLNILLFLVFLIFYMVTITGNLLIILSVSIFKSLNSPMYLFLCQLSICDILITSNIVPYMLHVILRKEEIISFIGCMTQFYLFGTFATTECILLAVMSYDRYVAICNPLQYVSLMDTTKCFNLTILSWLIGFILMLFTVFQVSRLNFCGSNVIDHFFCDLAPLLLLSCSDISFVEIENFILGFPATFCPFTFIIATYIYIFTTIIRIPSSIGRQKAFSTCSSHLTIVCIYYGTLVAAYLFLSKEKTSNVSKVISLLYTVVTPLLNPIIYSLRSKEIKTSLVKLIAIM